MTTRTGPTSEETTYASKVATEAPIEAAIEAGVGNSAVLGKARYPSIVMRRPEFAAILDFPEVNDHGSYALVCDLMRIWLYGKSSSTGRRWLVHSVQGENLRGESQRPAVYDHVGQWYARILVLELDALKRSSPYFEGTLAQAILDAENKCAQLSADWLLAEDDRKELIRAAYARLLTQRKQSKEKDVAIATTLGRLPGAKRVSPEVLLGQVRGTYVGAWSKSDWVAASALGAFAVPYYASFSCELRIEQTGERGSEEVLRITPDQIGARLWDQFDFEHDDDLIKEHVGLGRWYTERVSRTDPDPIARKVLKREHMAMGQVALSNKVFREFARKVTGLSIPAKGIVVCRPFFVTTNMELKSAPKRTIDIRNPREVLRP